MRNGIQRNGRQPPTESAALPLTEFVPDSVRAALLQITAVNSPNVHPKSIFAMLRGISRAGQFEVFNGQPRRLRSTRAAASNGG